MNYRTPQDIDAELKALRLRIQRLRLEQRAAALAENEKGLLQESSEVSIPGPPAADGKTTPRETNNAEESQSS